ncbi:SDR family NAD(P)-dependent oxidoreductase [Spirosoma utsteinense]|uniref:NAD(P)-dependent dehydrogenase (Short-subunit alcohol dehydrogenase family) n=1 Tax=Spirosoma utsteinense TaxID=2585773 RepID=A0ABR6WA13_9BACT|nr:SDR family oxidoreductase [Spirosoma utsteinense]MBC3787697.1 NAD(P)-dependent dehydrogenase (short-subunit alcohol dehydrogenase family) [Spirosoma utsteinense]MBC3792700.1 NAD(P)-dependent dehydrogenase (short-subunit alcohol dehydrogenase family) [Spirosoma utsteinense]
MFSLQYKTALITGGASGIGLAIAQGFAQAGAHVHILDLNGGQAEQVASDIRRLGNKATGHAVDVSNQQQAVEVIGRIAAQEPIHILVNNAGVSHIGTVETTTEADFDRIFRINVKGVYNCLYAVIPHLKANGGGVILNMASVAASLGLSERFAYSMSKGAVLTMTLSVAKDYLADKIRCNCISPARVHTPFVDGFLAKSYPGQEAEMFEKLSKTQPIGRMAEPSEVGALALYLCSDEAGFVTGCDYPLDGGFTRLNT